jgi:hypothetical protein
LPARSPRMISSRLPCVSSALLASAVHSIAAVSVWSVHRASRG